MDSKMDQCYNLPQLQSLTINSLFDLDAPSVSWDAILGLCSEKRNSATGRSKLRHYV